MASDPKEHHHQSIPRLLIKRVSSWEQSLHRLVLSSSSSFSRKRVNSQQHLLQMEKQLETFLSPRLNTTQQANGEPEDETVAAFQMPVHYARYTRDDYEGMPEWRLDCLFREYGLPLRGDVAEKRDLAMGTFVWK